MGSEGEMTRGNFVPSIGIAVNLTLKMTASEIFTKLI